MYRWMVMKPVIPIVLSVVLLLCSCQQVLVNQEVTISREAIEQATKGDVQTYVVPEQEQLQTISPIQEQGIQQLQVEQIAIEFVREKVVLFTKQGVVSDISYTILQSELIGGVEWHITVKASSFINEEIMDSIMDLIIESNTGTVVAFNQQKVPTPTPYMTSVADYSCGLRASLLSYDSSSMKARIIISNDGQEDLVNINYKLDNEMTEQYPGSVLKPGTAITIPITVSKGTHELQIRCATCGLLATLVI